jgi:hypothetical protein
MGFLLTAIAVQMTSTSIESFLHITAMTTPIG